MAIRKTKEEDGKAFIEIDNGHLQTLKKITEDYKIQDIEKTLGFILTVISKSEGKPIHVGENTFVPADAIRRKENVTLNPPIETPAI